MGVFAIREDEPELIVSNLTLVKREVALGRLRLHLIDEEDSVDNRGRSSLKKDCDPEEIKITGYERREDIQLLARSISERGALVSFSRVLCF